MPGFGCSDAYNMGQMLYRPRDAVVGRPAGPADGTVTAAAIARYRDGKVPALNTTGMSIGRPGRHRRRHQRGRWRRRRRRLVDRLEQLRLRHVGFRNRAASAVRCRR